MRICSRSSASAGTIRPLPTPATAACRFSQRQRIHQFRRRAMEPHPRIQQRLGFRPERRHQQGLSRDQVRRGVPPGQVPVLPGSRLLTGSVNYSSNQTAFPSTKTSSLGPTVGASTGDAIASALLGQVDSATISTTNFISSQKVAWAGYVQDDWKVSRKLTAEHRPCATNSGRRSASRFGRQANFDLQTMTLYIPKASSRICRCRRTSRPRSRTSKCLAAKCPTT